MSGVGQAVCTRGLVKRFGGLLALAGVDLDVDPGEVVGLLGPNGAGKTTILRCLVGHLHPTSGTVTVFGGDPGDRRVRARTGYLPCEGRPDPGMRVGSLLRWYSDLRGGVGAEQIPVLCERLELDVRRTVGDLSTGNRRKIGLVQALAHEPDLILLDEPTSGLDPLVQREVVALIAERKAAGAAVLYSSHVLHEVEEVADRVILLRSGRVLDQAGRGALGALGGQRLVLHLAAPSPVGLLDGVPGVVAWRAEGSDLVVDVVGPVSALLRAVVPLDVLSLQSHEKDLEQVFVELYQGLPAEPAPASEHPTPASANV